jgi:dTDP-4-dehydrorhamnose 3,5-epimerase
MVIEPDRKLDDRGYFVRTFCKDTMSDAGLVSSFVQCGTAFNLLAGTVRGMHFQRFPHGEVKLIRVTHGAIYDIVIDLRRDQPTYLKYFGIILSAENGRSLYVPKEFAHGYQTLEDDTEVLYSFSTAYAPDVASGLRWDDPALGLKWPLPITKIAMQDQQWPLIA